MIAQRLAVLASPLALLSSCFLNSFEYSPIRSDDGIVWIRWTVDGRADERSCPSFNATTARVTVLRSDGTVAARADRSCDDFVSRHELDPGGYRASVSLLDQEDHVVAGPREVGFLIEEDDNELVDVGFVTPDLL